MYDYFVGDDGQLYPFKPCQYWEEPKKMRKVERRFTVVALECTGDNMLLNQVQVVADGHYENLTFMVPRENVPELGAKLTVTIEQE